MMTEIRCVKCHALLFKVDAFNSIEIKCRKCGHVRIYKTEPDGSNIIAWPIIGKYRPKGEIEDPIIVK